MNHIKGLVPFKIVGSGFDICRRHVFLSAFIDYKAEVNFLFSFRKTNLVWDCQPYTVLQIFV